MVGVKKTTVALVSSSLSKLRKGFLFPDSREHSDIVLDGKLYRFKVCNSRSIFKEEPEDLIFKLPYADYLDEECDLVSSDDFVFDSLNYYIPVTLPTVIDLSKLPEKIASQYAGIPDGYFPRKEAQLLDKCYNCGNWASYEYYCKSCISAGRDGLLKTHTSNLYCGSRYCWNADCVVDRFAGNIEILESIDTFALVQNTDEFGNFVSGRHVGKGSLRELWHMSFDTELISLDDFRNDFTIFKKKFEYVLSNFWSRMKKKGASCYWKQRNNQNVCLPAVRVLDFSFERNDEGKVFVHYHFGVIPPKSGCASKVKRLMNEVRAEVLMGQRNKFLFNWHEHKCKGTKSGYTPIKGLLPYLAKRSAGMYKHGEGENVNWDTEGESGKMKKDIEAGKYFGLQDFLTVEEYVAHFHGRRHYATVGGLPRGSNRTDNIESEMPNYCPHCEKELIRSDISVRIQLNVPPPPKFS